MTTARDRPPEEAAEDTSFARGLRVLLTIADRGEIRADELSSLLDTPMSTIYRYLRTLTEFGFVDRQGAGYRLGPRLVIGGGPTVSSEDLIRLADPILRSLAEETGETAVISRRVGLSAVCLSEAPSPHPLRVSLEPGTAFPLHVGAIGKVLLAYAPPEVLGEVVAPGAASGRRTDPEDQGAPPRAPRGRRRRHRPIRGGGDPRHRGSGRSHHARRRDRGHARRDRPEARCGLAWRARVSRLLPDAAASIVGLVEQRHQA